MKGKSTSRSFIKECEAGDHIKGEQLLMKGVVLVDPELYAVSCQQLIDRVGILT